jgi:hypothetical protein
MMTRLEFEALARDGSRAFKLEVSLVIDVKLKGTGAQLSRAL